MIKGTCNSVNNLESPNQISEQDRQTDGSSIIMKHINIIILCLNSYMITDSTI